MSQATATEFDLATAVEPLGDGAYAAVMDTGWWVMRGPNGGYVAAVLLRALADALVVAAMTDAWFPAVFTRLTEPAALPTIDLTIHFRAPLPLAGARPDDWLLAVFRSRLGRDGFVEEDGEIWSADGELLAQSRQLALMV